MKEMFSDSLNELIRASLTDGVITDKEREVIRKRAVAEGVDPDLVDVMIDASVQDNAQHRRARQRICPHCGAELEAFSTRCPACGEEIRNGRAVSSIQQFSCGIEEIASSQKSAREKRKDTQNFIEAFNVPNRREDLMEFLSLAAANANKAKGIMGTWRRRFFSVLGASFVGWVVLTLVITWGKETRFHNFFLDVLVIIFIGIFFTLFTGLPLALWLAKKGGNDTQREQNLMAPVWKRKFKEVLQQARGTLRNPEDVAMLNQLDSQV